jgi:hypothetical protein
MEQVLSTLPAHLSSPQNFSEAPVVHIVQLHVSIRVFFNEKVNINIYAQYSQMNNEM